MANKQITDRERIRRMNRRLEMARKEANDRKRRNEKDIASAIYEPPKQ